MKDREQLSCWIHHSMAVTGGYLGVYALLCRNDFFGNALTSNLIYIVTGILGRDPLDVFIRIGGVMLYVLGIAATVFLSKKYHRNLRPISLFINYIVVILLGFLPADMDPVLGLYPIFFAMAFQWNSFPGAYGFTSSTIFSTNNTRQVANALSEYCITHEKRQLQRAAFFGGTLICFHIGVAFSWITHHFIGIRSVWLCVVPLLVSTVLIAYESQLNRVSVGQKDAAGAPIKQA